MNTDASTPEGSAAPPRVSAPEDAAPPPSKWPTVVGVIGIIVASLGLLGSVCCGLASPLYMPAAIEFMKQAPNMTPEQIDAKIAAIPPLYYILPASLVGLALSVLLMVGSIGLVRRRERSVKLLKIWAWTDLGYNVVSLPIQVMFQMRGTAYPGAGPEEMIGPASTLCCGGLLGFVFPIFVLMWLSRRAIKDEILMWAELRQGAI